METPIDDLLDGPEPMEEEEEVATPAQVVVAQPLDQEPLQQQQHRDAAPDQTDLPLPPPEMAPFPEEAAPTVPSPPTPTPPQPFPDPQPPHSETTVAETDDAEMVDAAPFANGGGGGIEMYSDLRSDDAGEHDEPIVPVDDEDGARVDDDQEVKDDDSLPRTPEMKERSRLLRSVVKSAGPKSAGPKSAVKFAPETVLPPTPPSEGRPMATQTPQAATPAANGRGRKFAETQTPPQTDPVIRYMVRPSPLSSEKFTSPSVGGGAGGDILPRIVAKLSRSSLPQERHLGVKALTQYARQNGTDDPAWGRHFGDVLECLLDGFSDRDENAVKNKDVLAPVPLNAQNLEADEKSSEEKEMILSTPAADGTAAAATRHLYIQGVRALLKYIPSHFEGHVEVTMVKLLECAKCTKFEIVHTAERALENLVTSCPPLDPTLCLRSLLPYLKLSSSDDGENGDDEWAIPLLALRTLCKLADRVPARNLLEALSSTSGSSSGLGACLVMGMRHKAVDVRKAAIFAAVEMHFAVAGDGGAGEGADGDGDVDGFNDAVLSRLDGLTAANRKLISIYIERHPKTTAAATGQQAGVAG